jgi:hypothetical protein
MNTQKPKKKKQLIDVLLKPVEKYIEWQDYKAAAENLLFIVKAFGLQDEALQLIEDTLTHLSYDNASDFEIELLYATEVSNEIANEYFGEKEKNELEKFKHSLNDILKFVFVTDDGWFMDKNITKTKQIFLNMLKDYISHDATTIVRDTDKKTKITITPTKDYEITVTEIEDDQIITVTRNYETIVVIKVGESFTVIKDGSTHLSIKNYENIKIAVEGNLNTQNIREGEEIVLKPKDVS